MFERFDFIFAETTEWRINLIDLNFLFIKKIYLKLYLEIP